MRLPAGRPASGYRGLVELYVQRDKRAQGQEAAGEDAARLSPLADAHINMPGRYAFTAPPDAGLRPLRDPRSPGKED